MKTIGTLPGYRKATCARLIAALHLDDGSIVYKWSRGERRISDRHRDALVRLFPGLREDIHAAVEADLALARGRKAAAPASERLPLVSDLSLATHEVDDLGNLVAAIRAFGNWDQAIGAMTLALQQLKASSSLHGPAGEKRAS